MNDISVATPIKVFLSHSSADNKLARKLASSLRSANIDVWFDQWEVRVGEEFVQKIENGLLEVEFVIVLLTRASVASEWVDREWRSKVENEAETKSVAVVPVRGESCDIPDFLAQRSYADISGGSYLLGVRHLLTILHHYSNTASIKLPEDPIEKKECSESMFWVVTPIALEVSKDLIPIFEPDAQGASRALDELAPGMRDALQAELGFPFPGIRIRGNETDMPPRSALIMIDEVPEIMFEVGLDDVLVDGTIEKLAALGIRGEPRNDPATGRARARIAATDRSAAEDGGLATWDAAEYLFLAVHAVVRRMAALFLDIDVTWRLVDDLERTSAELVTRTVPKVVSWFELTDVLRRLVDEEIGIRDMERILEVLSRRERDVRDTVVLAEQVRHALSGQITAKFARGRNSLPVFQLDLEIEALMSSAMQRSSAGTYLALEPQITEDIMAAIRGQMRSMGSRATGVPILVTDVEVRPYIRKMVSLEFPALHVLSRQDIDPDMQILEVAPICLRSASQLPTRTDQGAST
jgi:type III secretory pathway component EscV